MATPAKAFELIGKGSTNFTKSSKYESKMLSANKVQVSVTPYINVKEKSFQCENRQGFFVAITMIFNYSNRLITREIGQVINRYNNLNDVLSQVVSVKGRTGNCCGSP